MFEDRNGTRDISLQDMNGRMIQQWQGVTGNTIQAENIRPGIYTLRVTIRETGFQGVEKIIVSR